MDDELKHYLEGMESRIKVDMAATEERLIERMRDMQTELLRGFEAFSAGQVLRVRKVEADQSNLNSALSGRVDILESWLLQIELRMGMAGQKRAMSRAPAGNGRTLNNLPHNSNSRAQL